MNWVKLERYCELTGETRNSVKAKRLGIQRKSDPTPPLWVEGVHWKTGPDKRIWVNTEAVDQWLDAA